MIRSNDLMGIRARKGQECQEGIKEKISEPNISYSAQCGFCRKSMRQSIAKESVCGRCFAPYCSDDCLRKDYPKHKHNCKKQAQVVRIDTKSRYDRYATCSDEVREQLDGIDWASLAFSLPIEDCHAPMRACMEKIARGTTVDGQFMFNFDKRVVPPSKMWLCEKLLNG